MKEITLESYAKVNLSLDVLDVLPNGYHKVEMVMQQLELHDLVRVSWEECRGEGDIRVESNRPDVPSDSSNLGYKAAALMLERFGKKGKAGIFIEKHIPVAAGLAGGSGNGAAVLHALNALWGLGLSVGELCEIGVKLGADVPFCIMGQAKGNKGLGRGINDSPLACSCALAEGIGEQLTPLPPLAAYILISKPPISISTAEAYRGLDKEVEYNGLPHYNTNGLIEGLKAKNYSKIVKNMSNILELFSAKRYPIIMYTKDMIEQEASAAKILMSGSGPSVFAVYFDEASMKQGYKALCKVNKETFATKTLA